MSKFRVRKLAAAAAVAGALAVGSVVVAPQAADAAVVGCWHGRCDIYLSKSETVAFGQGRLSPPGASSLGMLATMFVLTHRAFAQVYGMRGECSAFQLSIYPWETQGYYGYRCNWN